MNKKVDEVAGVLDGRQCPNCRRFIVGHPQNSCVLAALITILGGREMPLDELLDLHANANVDALWEDLGVIIDRLQDGVYSS